jgi:hypothetical protein
VLAVRTGVLVIGVGLLCCTVLSGRAIAQFQEGDPEGTRLGESQVSRWQAGLIVTASTGPCQGLVGTAPIPFDWPEQQVRIVDEDVSPKAKVSYRMVGGTAKQMVVEIRYLPAGEEARALITLEIERHVQLPPDDTDQYVLPNPRRLPRDVRVFLGPSPKIESRNAKIRKLAKQIGVDRDKAWERVEAIYDWVRNKVTYREGPLKGALAALENGVGDCEDLTSLFVAICRAADIPARTVWVPDHCYPEFYLLDAEGKGHWFPCQAAGARAFGGIPELRPILQKGDNFRSASNPRDRQRYLREELTGTGGRPKVKFIRKPLAG